MGVWVSICRSDLIHSYRYYRPLRSVQLSLKQLACDSLSKGKGFYAVVMAYVCAYVYENKSFTKERLRKTYLQKQESSH